MADNFELKFKLDDGGLARQIKELNKHLKSITSTTSKLSKEEKKLVDTQKKLNNEVKKSGRNTKKSNEVLRLHRKEHRLLKAELAKTNRTFKDIGITQKTVSASFQGSTAALSRMRKAMSLMRKEAAITNKGLFDITNGGRLLDNSFATIRSKLLLVSFAFGLVTNSIVRQVKMFGEQEQSVMKMARVFGTDAAQSLSEFSSSLQEITTFGDESINSVIALMGSFGANAEQSKELTKATLDLSAGLGVDLNSAALLISKTFGSTTDAMGRYGIKVDSTLKGQERLEAITKGVQDRFGELAKLMALTTSGQLQQASNAFGDLQERLGQALAPTILLVANALKLFSNAIPLGLLKALVSITLGLASAFGAYRVVLSATTKTGAIYQAGLAIKIAKTKLLTIANVGLIASLKKVDKAMLKSKAGLITAGIVFLATSIISLIKSTSGLTTEQKKLQERMDAIAEQNGINTKGNEDLIRSIIETTDAIEKEISIIDARMSSKGLELAIKLKEIDLGRKLDKIEKDALKRLFERKELEKEIADTQKIIDNEDALLKQINLQQAQISLTGFALIKRQEEIKLGRALSQIEEDRLKTIQNNKLIIDNINKEKKSTDDLTQSKKDFSKQVSNDIELMMAKALEDEIALEILKEEIRLNRVLSKEEKDLLNLKRVIKTITEGTGNNNGALEEESEIIKTLNGLYEQTTEAKRKLLEAQIAEADAIMFTGEMTDEQVEGYNVLIDRYNAMDNATDKHIAKLEEERQARIKQASTIAMISDSFVGLGQAVGASEKQVMYFQAISAVANAYSAASDVLADKTIQPTALRIGAAASMYVNAYAQVRGIYEQIQKAGGSGSGEAAQTFEYGGMVGGQRHSQGGTLIEAERGEFVMSRNAVESIGVETLNQMNQGGSTGNVVVNVSGNVMTQDFVEGELAESIKEAVRRGSDFGLN